MVNMINLSLHYKNVISVYNNVENSITEFVEAMKQHVLRNTFPYLVGYPHLWDFYNSLSFTTHALSLTQVYEDVTFLKKSDKKLFMNLFHLFRL